MLDRKNLVQLMKTVAKADPSTPTAYSFNGESLSYDALNETLRRELNELAGTYSLYRENKNLIFSMIEETIDEVLPKKVEEQYNQFAEVKTFRQGDKPIFRRKFSNNTRAKQFITRVGLAGIYEVFKLGPAERESFEVRTSAIGGAAQIGFEEFLDGRVDFAEVTKIIMEGMDELIYKEVAAALKASINQLPPANRVAAAGFDESAMDRLIQIASAYGTPTIYCTYEFAVRMIPQEAWRYTESMKTELWNTGRLASYKGTKVVIIEQGFEVTYVDVDENGVIKLNELKKAIRPTTILISVMFANNEIGTIQPIKEIGEIAKEHGILFHTDAVQAFGQVPINVDECHIDMLSASGHKLNGPKGIGFLYIRKGVKIRSFVHGGCPCCT